MRVFVDVVLSPSGGYLLKENLPYAWMEDIGKEHPAHMGRTRHLIVACSWFSMRVQIYQNQELVQIRDHITNSHLLVPNFSYRTQKGRADLEQDLFAFGFARKSIESMHVRYIEDPEDHLNIFFDLNHHPCASTAPFAGSRFFYQKAPQGGFELSQFLDGANPKLVPKNCHSRYVGRAIILFKEKDLQFPINPKNPSRVSKTFKELAYRNVQVLRTRSASQGQDYLITHKAASLLDALNGLTQKEIVEAYQQTAIHYGEHPEAEINKADRYLLYAHHKKMQIAASSKKTFENTDLDYLPHLKSLPLLSFIKIQPLLITKPQTLPATAMPTMPSAPTVSPTPLPSSSLPEELQEGSASPLPPLPALPASPLVLESADSPFQLPIDDCESWDEWLENVLDDGFGPNESPSKRLKLDCDSPYELVQTP